MSAIFCPCFSGVSLSWSPNLLLICDGWYLSYSSFVIVIVTSANKIDQFYSTQFALQIWAHFYGFFIFKTDLDQDNLSNRTVLCKAEHLTILHLNCFHLVPTLLIQFHTKWIGLLHQTKSTEGILRTTLKVYLCISCPFNVNVEPT